MDNKEHLEYNKLVRDKIPQIIIDSGANPQWRSLTAPEFLPAAIDTLYEEAQELVESTGNDRLGELADLWEVLNALAEEMGWSMDDVVAAAAAKNRERGAFTERVWLISTETRPVTES